MDLGIRGKVALVTASSKGLGKASALALAREGAKVVITARGEDTLAKAREEIEAAAGSGSVHAIATDITHPSAPASVVRDTLDTFGALDILVPNAGGPPPGRALDVTEAQIEAAVNANLITSVRLVREALPALRSGGQGRICCITSYTVKQPEPNLALSNLARTGLWAWAKTAAQDLFPDVTLNLVCPGPHATDRMIQLGDSGRPMGDPDDFGSVVAFLCSRQAAFVSGTAVMVDGASSAGLL